VKLLDDLGFIHRFVPSASPGDDITLLLLHGTGGHEDDLLDLGRYVSPGAALLSPRGRVLENGMPRFFRRVAEGVFDLEDLKLQTERLGHLVRAASRKYCFAVEKVIAVGYSNGANTASSLLLTDPQLLTGAVLFRPMVPFVPDSLPDLRNLSVLLCAGRKDSIATAEQIERLTKLFEAAGANISTYWHEGGHELGDDDLQAARNWIAKWRSLR
jgi:predicted esterase